MTNEQLEGLNLGLPNNAETLLMVESGLQWVLDNTTLEFDINNIEELKALPAPVRLFVMKYNELLSKDQSVSSESIESLSQSFRQTGADELLWSIADALLGSYLKGRVRFVSAVSRWDYGG